MEGSEPNRLNEPDRLKLEGSWTIERAEELRRVLIEAVEGHERTLIESEGLTELDLCAMQLFCAAHRASLRLGKQLAFDEQRSETFRQMVRDVGFVRKIGCHKDPEISCLWKEGWTS